MNVWTVAWVLWIAAFFVIEGIALANRQDGDTLSENVWSWASIKTKGTAWRLRRFVLLSGLAWVVAHFLTGGLF